MLKALFECAVALKREERHVLSQSTEARLAQQQSSEESVDFELSGCLGPPIQSGTNVRDIVCPRTCSHFGQQFLCGKPQCVRAILFSPPCVGEWEQLNCKNLKSTCIPATDGAIGGVSLICTRLSCSTFVAPFLH